MISQAKKDLAKSDISVEDADYAGMFSVRNAQEIYSEFKKLQALVIPYFRPDGQDVFHFERDGDKLPFCRVRYYGGDQPQKAWHQPKTLRYGQPGQSGCWAYFPRARGLSWREVVDDTSVPIVLTEGEKKALRGCIAGIPTIGLGGVFNFMRQGRFLPELDAVNWQNRPVYVCFDSDAASNPMIQAAEGRLATELGLQRNANLLLARIPESPSGDKVGLDDYIVEHGEDAFFDLLESSMPMRRIDTAVLSLNQHVAFIEREGMVFDLQKNYLLPKQTFTNGSRFSALEVLQASKRGSVKRIKVAEEWLTHPHAQRYDELLFRPEFEDRVITTDKGEQAINLWTGWEPRPGNVEPFIKLHEYLHSDMDKEFADLPLKLMAYKAQNPGAKIPLALFYVGLQGSGKSMWAAAMREAFKPYSHDIPPASFGSDFNGWLENCLLAVVDEVQPQDIRGSAQSFMWRVITESMHQMNEKYRIPRQIRCYTQLILTSNKRQSVAFSQDDRRMIVISAPPKHPDDTFYADVAKWLEAGNGPALLHYLLTYDLKGWTPPDKAPLTPEKYMAYMESLTAAQRIAEDVATADEHVIAMWITSALQWARTAEVGAQPGPARLAHEIITTLPRMQIRPWYTAEELAMMFPAITAQLYGTRSNISAAGQLSAELRDAGITYIRNRDNPRGFYWRGRLQQFLVVAEPEEWRQPISQKEFDDYMQRFMRYQDYIKKGS